MHSVEVGGVEHKLECNAFTPFIYAEEFTVERKGRMVPEDINAAVTEIGAFLDEYGAPPLLKMMQLFWAFEKTADSKTPSFKTWLKKLPAEALDLSDGEGWAKVVTDILTESFFPAAAQQNMASAT